MMPPPGPKICLRPRVALTFDLVTSKVDRFMPLGPTPWTTLVPICIKIGWRVCIARIMLWKYVCLSVRLPFRPSHAGILSKRLNVSSVFFHHQVSTPFPVCPYPTGWQYSDRDSPNEGVECKGIWKITIFDKYLALSRKLCKIEP